MKNSSFKRKKFFFFESSKFNWYHLLFKEQYFKIKIYKRHRFITSNINGKNKMIILYFVI
jgi:hypothetical protein